MVKGFSGPSLFLANMDLSTLSDKVCGKSGWTESLSSMGLYVGGERERGRGGGREGGSVDRLQ
jgi:hypothetical protein